MAQKTITVTIQPDGHSVVEANNFKGVGCAQATQAIELALAGSDSSNRDDRKKPDFYATNPQSNTQRN
jgi:Protein of unknown function (DUF2997).